MKRSWRRGWYLINYEALRSNPAILTAPWDAIILDESTKIRSPRSQITKLITRHSDHITYKAILSGLPNPEDAADFFSQFQFLDGTFLGYDNYWAFRQRYFLTVGFGWHPKRGTRDLIKDAVGRRAFVLTRKQAGVGSEKVRQQRTVQLNGEQKKLLREMKKNFSVGGEETKWVPVVHTWMSHVAGGFHPKTKAMISDSKMRELEGLLTGELKDESVVVWFRFNHEIEAAYKWLKDRKVSVEFLHGAVANSKEKRPKVQERFQSGKTRVLLMQVKLGKYGWNLSRSSTAIYYSNSYEFEDRSQSEDRVVHLTKRNDCLYIDLVSEGTPDETVVEALTDKRMNAKLFSARIKQFVNQLVA